MKYERLWTVLVFGLMLMVASCGHETETITGPNPKPIIPKSQFPAEAPGLVGTFSGTIQNTDHTKNGMLTISITDYDQSSGALTGTLELTGFSDCFTTGIFPDPNHTNYDNRYSPQTRGFGFIQASGTKPGSYSFLYFEASNDFHNGLNLGVDELGFFDGGSWCLSISPVLLTRE